MKCLFRNWVRFRVHQLKHGTHTKRLTLFIFHGNHRRQRKLSSRKTRSILSMARVISEVGARTHTHIHCLLFIYYLRASLIFIQRLTIPCFFAFCFSFVCVFSCFFSSLSVCSCALLRALFSFSISFTSLRFYLYVNGHSRNGARKRQSERGKVYFCVFVCTEDINYFIEDRDGEWVERTTSRNQIHGCEKSEMRKNFPKIQIKRNWQPNPMQKHQYRFLVERKKKKKVIRSSGRSIRPLHQQQQQQLVPPQIFLSFFRTHTSDVHFDW